MQTSYNSQANYSLACVSSETHIVQRVFHPGGGVTPLYRLYRYVRRQRVCFCSRFGLKEGINFDQCGLKYGMVCALQSLIGYVFRRSYFFIIWR